MKKEQFKKLIRECIQELNNIDNTNDINYNFQKNTPNTIDNGDILDWAENYLKKVKTPKEIQLFRNLIKFLTGEYPF
jgi:DNA polymerase II large subunit